MITSENFGLWSDPRHVSRTALALELRPCKSDFSLSILKAQH